jgi:AmmeMemoRadiSam system protein A
MLPPSEDPCPSGPAPATASHEYSPEERKLLLKLAHEAILSRLEPRHHSPFTPSPHLAELRGVFTTLYLNKKLRGCVGYPAAIAPLYRAVMETAQAAAFDDPRFPPLEIDEASGVKISISVLSPLVHILPVEIEVGRHGLVISAGGCRGLLLPQVPVEHGWDRKMFLEQTCRKAGLSANAWHSGAKIEAFTAEVFSDD